jgi:hypothetical protein
MGAPDVQVLLLCGASGSGKFSTAREVGHRLEGLGTAHAVLDTDELDRVWPRPEPVEALNALSRRNLRSWWQTLSELGVRRLVLCGVMASVATSEAWIPEAVPGSTVTFVRLVADHSTREERLRRREIGSGFAHDMAASDRAEGFMAEHDQAGLPIVVTDDRPVEAVADNVLEVVGWTAEHFQCSGGVLDSSGDGLERVDLLEQGPPTGGGDGDPDTGPAAGASTLNRNRNRRRWTGMSHAVVIQVEIDPNSDVTHRHAILNEFVIPQAKALPGFQKGSWMNDGAGRGTYVVVFGTEEQARCAPIPLMPEGGPPVIKIGVFEIEIEA